MNAAGDNTALGVLGWMAAIGNTHQRLTAADFMGKLETALHVGQLHILSRQGKPVAWLIWRKPDAEVWTQLRHHLAHFPVDTAALADYIWLDFWIRPFGCDAALSQLVAQTFHERGIAQPRFCWRDPGAEGGSGRWHVGIRDLQGI